MALMFDGTYDVGGNPNIEFANGVSVPQHVGLGSKIVDLNEERSCPCDQPYEQTYTVSGRFAKI